jgi:hypothetical protein
VQVRKVEEQVRKLGPEITGKKGEASKLLVGLKYKSTERLEEALRYIHTPSLPFHFSLS